MYGDSLKGKYIISKMQLQNFKSDLFCSEEMQCKLFFQKIHIQIRFFVMKLKLEKSNFYNNFISPDRTIFLCTAAMILIIYLLVLFL